MVNDIVASKETDQAGELDSVAAEIHKNISIVKEDVSRLGSKLEQLRKKQEAYVADNRSVRAIQLKFEGKRLKVSPFFINT